MQSTLMLKQILDVNKKAFEESLNAMIAISDHAEKMVRIFWERSAFFPIESKKVIEDWVCQYKNSLDDFRDNVDKRFQLMEYYILNTADSMESSMRTVVNKTVPASQVYETTKKPAAVSAKKDVSVQKTVKKKNVTLKKK